MPAIPALPAAATRETAESGTAVLRQTHTLGLQPPMRYKKNPPVQCFFNTGYVLVVAAPKARGRA